MIAYLDAGALVKRYVAEAGSAEVGGLIGEAEAVGTAIISRAEVAAALAKAVRMRLLPRDEAASALEAFNREWEDLVRLQMTEVLVSRAASLAWNHGLRGYDAAHLASASSGRICWARRLRWQATIGNSGRPRRRMALLLGRSHSPEYF